eukprot:GHVN01059198.1.p1 GENE.GHVN01059198.1~~GHVN01059198.1.p1  ORF type:complete len:1245 (+),score=100.15 GHVN01059198.1:265-3999(+)
MGNNASCSVSLNYWEETSSQQDLETQAWGSTYLSDLERIPCVKAIKVALDTARSEVCKTPVYLYDQRTGSLANLLPFNSESCLIFLIAFPCELPAKACSCNFDADFPVPDAVQNMYNASNSAFTRSSRRYPFRRENISACTDSPSSTGPDIPIFISPRTKSAIAEGALEAARHPTLDYLLWGLGTSPNRTHKAVEQEPLSYLVFVWEGVHASTKVLSCAYTAAIQLHRTLHSDAVTHRDLLKSARLLRFPQSSSDQSWPVVSLREALLHNGLFSSLYAWVNGQKRGLAPDQPVGMDLTSGGVIFMDGSSSAVAHPVARAICGNDPVAQATSPLAQSPPSVGQDPLASGKSIRSARSGDSNSGKASKLSETDGKPRQRYQMGFGGRPCASPRLSVLFTPREWTRICSPRLSEVLQKHHLPHSDQETAPASHWDAASSGSGLESPHSEEYPPKGFYGNHGSVSHRDLRASKIPGATERRAGQFKSPDVTQRSGHVKSGVIYPCSYGLVPVIPDRKGRKRNESFTPPGRSIRAFEHSSRLKTPSPAGFRQRSAVNDWGAGKTELKLPIDALRLKLAASKSPPSPYRAGNGYCLSPTSGTKSPVHSSFTPGVDPPATKCRDETIQGNVGSPTAISYSPGACQTGSVPSHAPGSISGLSYEVKVPIISGGVLGKGDSTRGDSEQRPIEGGAKMKLNRGGRLTQPQLGQTPQGGDNPNNRSPVNGRICKGEQKEPTNSTSLQTPLDRVAHGEGDASSRVSVPIESPLTSSSDYSSSLSSSGSEGEEMDKGPRRKPPHVNGTRMSIPPIAKAKTGGLSIKPLNLASLGPANYTVDRCVSQSMSQRVGSPTPTSSSQSPSSIQSQSARTPLRSRRQRVDHANPSSPSSNDGSVPSPTGEVGRGLHTPGSSSLRQRNFNLPISRRSDDGGSADLLQMKSPARGMKSPGSQATPSRMPMGIKPLNLDNLPNPRLDPPNSKGSIGRGGGTTSSRLEERLRQSASISSFTLSEYSDSTRSIHGPGDGPRGFYSHRSATELQGARMLDSPVSFDARASLESDCILSSDRVSSETGSSSFGGPPPDDYMYTRTREHQLDQYRYVCSEVLNKRLFIAGAAIAQSPEMLKLNSITHIINTTADTCPNVCLETIRYFNLYLKDSRDASEELEAVLYPAFDFIDSAFAASPNNRVLIHCKEGVSRSASIAVGFLMWLYGMPACKVLDRVSLAMTDFGINNSGRVLTPRDCISNDLNPKKTVC